MFYDLANSMCYMFLVCTKRKSIKKEHFVKHLFVLLHFFDFVNKYEEENSSSAQLLFAPNINCDEIVGFEKILLNVTVLKTRNILVVLTAF